MSNHIVTKAIVLSRRDYQEADRILTVITPDHGKLHLIAKGVRRPKSKLAGGIELFSLSDLTLLPGRSDLKTLTSSRAIEHYGEIVKDLDRTMLGYELLKQCNRHVEDGAEAVYFDIIHSAIRGLNNDSLSPRLIEFWFGMQVLNASGHAPNLLSDVQGTALQQDQEYHFDTTAMGLRLQVGAPLGASHIKVLRLAQSVQDPAILGQVKNVEQYLQDLIEPARTMVRLHLTHN